jgi:hypothetical protein
LTLRPSLRAAPLLALLSLTALLALPREARAYGWMIQHGYTSCATCHNDPSGAGTLTAYGRAQGDLLLRSSYGAAQTDEAGPTSGFLFGALRTPEALSLGGGIRAMPMYLSVEGAGATTDFILMQADIAGELHLGNFRAAGSIGAISSDQSPASISGHVVSREHWLGYAFLDGAALLRAGRINVPFGARTLDHTLYVRQLTRSDLNETQQHGLAFAYTGDLLRGEVMAIAGNFQAPSNQREQGYSGYLEISPSTWFAAGVSSLVTHSSNGQDVLASLGLLGAPTWRQAHGLFARVAPWWTLALTAEADFVSQAPDGQVARRGLATLLQADLEVLRGVHLMASGETKALAGSGGLSAGGWLGAGWFFAPHADLRLDFMQRSELYGNQRVSVSAYMAQLHLFF